MKAREQASSLRVESVAVSINMGLISFNGNYHGKCISL